MENTHEVNHLRTTLSPLSILLIIPLAHPSPPYSHRYLTLTTLPSTQPLTHPIPFHPPTLSSLSLRRTLPWPEATTRSWWRSFDYNHNNNPHQHRHNRHRNHHNHNNNNNNNNNNPTTKPPPPPPLRLRPSRPRQLTSPLL